MKNWARLVVLSCSLLPTAVAWASSYSCTGTLDWISVSGSGVVTVSSQSSGLGVFYPCQIGGTVYGVGPDTCKAMLAELMSARVTATPVSWWFNDSLTCNRAGGNWYWLGAPPSGWYYGPQT
jgi:hypothetical protein